MMRAMVQVGTNVIFFDADKIYVGMYSNSMPINLGMLERTHTPVYLINAM